MAEAYTKVRVLTMPEGGGGGGEGGTTNYNDLSNKPKINGTTLSGNKTLAQLGIASVDDMDGKQDTISDLATIRYGATDGRDAMIMLNNDSNYITLEAEDAETGEVTTFALFGTEIEEGGGE